MVGAFSVAGKVALVTGASSGLGASFAKLLARSGAAVGVVARRADRLGALVDEIASAGGKAHAVSLDVTDTAAIGGAVEQVEAALGCVDVLVNNAGMGQDSSALDATEEEYDRVMGTNTKAPYFVAQAVARRMVAAQRGGSIINIGSLTYSRPVGRLSAYCMSKSAIDHMTNCMAKEWARHEIRVNALHPGYVETEINAAFFGSEAGQRFVSKFPRRRIGTPADLDGPLLLLASDAGRFMTGSSVVVDDGQNFAV